MIAWTALVGLAQASPNLVLVSLDGLRADRVGAYGATTGATPTLDRLAAEGLRCELAFSQSNESLFSHAAMLSGRPVSELALPNYRTFTLPEEALLAPEILALYGYSTAGFVAGGHVKGSYGFAQGFSVWEDSADFGSFFHTVPAALDWLDHRARTPFFLLLHGYDTHRPYQKAGLLHHIFDAAYAGAVDQYSGRADVERIFGGVYYPDFPLEYFWHAGARENILDPSGYARLQAWSAQHPGQPLRPEDSAHLMAHYDSGALSADLQLGLFVHELERRGLWEQTLLIATSDHGEDMGDHGLYNHRSTLFDSSTRVPLILAGGALPAHLRGRTLPGPCSALDLLPTLLSAAGAEAPAGLNGQDLLGEPQPTLQIVQEGVLPMMALRSPTHRLVVQGIPLDTPLLETLLRVAPFEAPTWSLYDLRSDPGEQRDVLKEQRELALELRSALIDWVRRRPASSHAGTQPLDPAFQALLRSRGYW